MKGQCTLLTVFYLTRLYIHHRLKASKTKHTFVLGAVWNEPRQVARRRIVIISDSRLEVSRPQLNDCSADMFQRKLHQLTTRPITIVLLTLSQRNNQIPSLQLQQLLLLLLLYYHHHHHVHFNGHYAGEPGLPSSALIFFVNRDKWSRFSQARCPSVTHQKFHNTQSSHFTDASYWKMCNWESLIISVILCLYTLKFTRLNNLRSLCTEQFLSAKPYPQHIHTHICNHYLSHISGLPILGNGSPKVINEILEISLAVFYNTVFSQYC